MDESERVRQREEAERVARQERVAEAGGQLLAAAFTFLGQMLPQDDRPNGDETARHLRARLDDCLERDERGRARLTVTLPDDTALETLARSLAALIETR